jgi:hypothetical protein
MSQYDRNEDDEYNFYDSEDILNAEENDYDFYEADYEASGSDFRTTPDLKEAYTSSKTQKAGGGGLQFLVPPPLPLCHFDKQTSEAAGARTITGSGIRQVEHQACPQGSEKDGMHNPIICR